MTKFTNNLTILVLFIFSFNITTFGQTDTTSLRNNALKVFIPDNRYFGYFKDNMYFVNYVRDSKDAQVHIISTTQKAGNGGYKYEFIFIGQKEFKNQNDTLSFVSLADNTDDEIRNRQLKYLKLGLIKYVSHTQLAESLEINFTKNKEAKKEIVTDKWNSWVFTLSSQTWTMGESSYSNLNIWSNIRAERITPNWKIKLRAGNSYNQSKIVVDEDLTLRPVKSSYFSKIVIVKSLNDHWSVGGIVNSGNNTYSNFDFYTSIHPAIEYNIFPYSKSSINQFTFRFETGYKYADYTDSTVYNFMTEHLMESQLSTAYGITKKWGNINTSISGSTLMHDLSKYNVNLQTSLSLRIIKGLSLSLSGSISLIHNQIHLPKKDASYEEILLRQKQIASNYSYYMSAGLSYTFGSIYNNVVNPRFDN